MGIRGMYIVRCTSFCSTVNGQYHTLFVPCTGESLLQGFRQHSIGRHEVRNTVNNATISGMAFFSGVAYNWSGSFWKLPIPCYGLQNTSAPAGDQFSTHLAQDGKADLIDMRNAAVSHGDLVPRELRMHNLVCALQVV